MCSAYSTQSLFFVGWADTKSDDGRAIERETEFIRPKISHLLYCVATIFMCSHFDFWTCNRLFPDAIYVPQRNVLGAYTTKCHVLLIGKRNIAVKLASTRMRLALPLHCSSNGMSNWRLYPNKCTKLYNRIPTNFEQTSTIEIINNLNILNPFRALSFYLFKYFCKEYYNGIEFEIFCVSLWICLIPDFHGFGVTDNEFIWI